MKILVYGAGAVGSAFGGFLSRRHEVTLLGRRRHLEGIRRYGLRVSGIWGRHVFRRLGLETDFGRIVRGKPDFDWVLVTVKAYHTGRAAADVKKILRPGTLVISLQNGLGNIETLRRRIPAGQLAAGRVIFGVELPAAGPAGNDRRAGSIRITVSAAPTAIGETGVKKITPRVLRIAREFSECGISAVPSADIESLLWAKVIYNSALNPLASLLGSHYGLLGKLAGTRRIMETVIREIYAVAKKSGVRLDPRTAALYEKLFYSRLLPLTYHHHPSMLQDLERGRRTEIGALNGAIARLGARLGVPVPVNAALARLIRRMESEK